MKKLMKKIFCFYILDYFKSKPEYKIIVENYENEILDLKANENKSIFSNSILNYIFLKKNMRLKLLHQIVNDLNIRLIVLFIHQKYFLRKKC